MIHLNFAGKPPHVPEPHQARFLQTGTLFILAPDNEHPNIYMLIKPSIRTAIGIYDEGPLEGKPRAIRYEFLALRLTNTSNSSSIHLTGDENTEIYPLVDQDMHFNQVVKTVEPPEPTK